MGLNDWIDSTIVLSWLSKPASSWQTLIRNRISKIQSFLSFEKRYHVGSDEILDDICSRGISADKISNNSLWLHGPPRCSENHHDGHILQLLLLVFFQFKQSRLLYRLVEPATFNQI